MISKGIYGITDDSLLPGDLLLDGAEAALAAGVALLQYRSKNASAEDKLENACCLRQLCDKYQATLIINDDIELAKASEAHGVHLGRSDGDISEARLRLGDEAIIGVTCHDSIDLAVQAQKDGADYLAFGRFFTSQTKPEASPASLGLLKEAKQILDLPIVAIGGINAENGAALIDGGADILAVIHSLFVNTGDASEIENNAHKLVSLFE